MSVQVDLIKSNNWVEAIFMVFVSVIFAVLSIAAFITIAVLAGLEIDISQLIKYSIVEIINNPTTVLRMLYWATPLILTGLAVAVAFQAGLFNIGGQGQMLIGGVSAAIWAAAIAPTEYFPFNLKIIMIPSTLVVGFVAGAFWGFIPGYLKAKRGSHEVIVTIMMNLIATSLVTYLVGSQTYSPFVDTTSTDAYGQTNVIAESSRVGLIFPSLSNSLNWTTMIAIFIIILFHIVIYYTKYGFKLRAVGYNQVAAETAGIDSDRMIISSMTISGGLAGLAGVFYVIGTSPYRYVSGFEGTLGFDGIAVALIAQNSPIAIGLAAIFFGFLQEGKNSLDNSTNIPPDILFALQAFVIIFIAAPSISRWFYVRLRKNNEKIIVEDKDKLSPDDTGENLKSEGDVNE